MVCTRSSLSGPTRHSKCVDHHYECPVWRMQWKCQIWPWSNGQGQIRHLSVLIWHWSWFVPERHCKCIYPMGNPIWRSKYDVKFDLALNVKVKFNFTLHVVQSMHYLFIGQEMETLCGESTVVSDFTQRSRSGVTLRSAVQHAKQRQFRLSIDAYVTC